MNLDSLENLHEECIKGTEKESVVANKRIMLCCLTYAVRRSVDFSSNNVYISTKALKHIYDKKPAEHYDSIIRSLHDMVRFPDHIYKNKNGKRGNYCLVKGFGDKKYLCSIEDKGIGELNIVTVFRTDDKYLAKYELLWSWKDDAPSS